LCISSVVSELTDRASPLWEIANPRQVLKCSRCKWQTACVHIEGISIWRVGHWQRSLASEERIIFAVSLFRVDQCWRLLF
jgi:hypothetical protein